MSKKFTSNSSYKVIRITDNENIKLTFDTYYNFEKRNYDIINIPNDTELIDIILDNIQVDAIVVQFENIPYLPVLESLPEYYKRKIFYYDTQQDYGIDFALKLNKIQLKNSSTPLFSIVTPLYKTKLEYFEKAYASLAKQSLNDWEWILIDDSPEELEYIKEFIKEKKDVRLKYYRISPTNGNIGLSKWRGNCMSTGKWLVEFDHDDLLLPWALETMKKAIDEYPNNKFVYSDTITIDANDKIMRCPYGDIFGMGYGFEYISKSPRKYSISEVLYTHSSGPITNATIRHIVGVPNHVRCWERNFYFSIGGHNQDVRIADDYELLVRSFLNTKFTHIKCGLYCQRFDGNNSQYKEDVQDGDGQGNICDIQRRVRLISIHYEEKIHKRLEEFGLDDSQRIEGDPYRTALQYEQLHPAEYCDDDYIPDFIN